MQKFIFSLFVITISLSVANGKVKLTPEQIEMLKGARSKCEAEHNTPPEIIEKAKRGTLENDEGLKKFLFCFFKQITFMNEDATYNLGAMQTALTSALDNGQEVYDNCSIKVGSSGPETAFMFAQCFHDHVTDHSFEEQY